MIEYVNRKGSDSYKWDSDGAKDCLPLSVADMDFKIAPPIQHALQQRLEHGVFGYTFVPQANYDAVAYWFARRHGWKGISSSNLLYTTSVVAGISAVLEALKNYLHRRHTLRVLTFIPAYNCFFSCIRNMQCELVSSALVLRGNRFEIDFEDIAQKAKQADVLLLCNPHNPTGRVWSKDELQQLAEIMHNEHVFVLSDEIHCEFTFPKHPYTPFATIAASDKEYCVCTSASKAFNLASLLCSNIFVPDNDLFCYVSQALEVHEVAEINPFGLVAQVAAYNESEAWLDELNEYVYSNFLYLRDYIHEFLPMLHIYDTEGTYLAWINIADTGMNAEKFCQELVKNGHVLVNPSEMYGAEHYIRINLATSREVLTEALNRLHAFAAAVTYLP